MAQILMGENADKVMTYFNVEIQLSTIDSILKVYDGRKCFCGELL